MIRPRRTGRKKWSQKDFMLKFLKKFN
jgi:hypothetical protein